MSGNLCLVLGDQLTPELASLRDLDAASDIVLLVEVADESRYVPHHKQKIVLVLSAMRHFAADLRSRGIRVDYVQLDDPANTGSFTGELQRAVARHRPSKVVLTEPGEWRVWEMMQSWQAVLGLPVEIRTDERFLCSRAEFSQWLEGRNAPRMEFFYREMRRKTGWLMEAGKPVGGDWNFDSENRKKLPAREVVPVRQGFVPDATTREVMALVALRCADHPGDGTAFHWAVTREGALRALADFLREGLPRFGDYQDAMRAGAPWVFHSIISPYLNIGLLLAREVCEAAVAEWQAGRAPLNAVEGFVRQILGWREYVHGLYWSCMPNYGKGNFLDAQRPLPSFYWTGDTPMRCLRETVQDTLRHAYAHHIQRLMVTGNFALLAGLKPSEVEAWYLSVYADAFDWVELPNVHGMVLHADGGFLGSKPYAASGAYIDRMSDYCKGCAFDVKQKSGTTACPFNYLYWDFLLRNEPKLSGNPRMAMPYRSLAAMDADRKAQIRDDASHFLESLS